jgi:5-methylcytosine-specific restriction endonuclease McrA
MFVNDFFIINVSEQDIKKEKEKARLLRKKRWWKELIAKGECYYCKKKIPPNELTMDHIVPLIRGGKSTKGNIVPCCKECNNKKRYMLPIEWSEYIENLKKQG